ncbi:glycerate kinase [Sporosarcina pasteurii]|uniref:Glycerate kinase n=1 Tax=Sporosarcina pasteurii TaxID=1474 RepID=A0A380BD31_SPOPA|nr:glycerate kinase [Sporosarcina pasteurii]MDS9472594.1 glycerate kinase [Sporosarcina pasteurii]QBQ06144.1 glycerate kinase [Sporosarcina pasteurii]SUI99341.1 Glycerate kinase [Sporosarcina pasteurii]
MKIVIAPDSFKGSLSAVEVANAINQGVQKAYPHAKTHLLPVADGGEGTMETLVSATDGKMKAVFVTGPLGGKVEAAYGILGNGKTCVIEIASASGLARVPEGKLAPLQATTYGMGQLIKQALDDGFSSFIIALGGSATNDGGAGMLQALGAKLLDREGNEVSFGGGNLANIADIDITQFDSRIKESSFLIASDVQNPLVGLNGASHVFGPQKGATPEDVKLLDENMVHWANQIEKVTGISLHNQPGAGAAGGIGGAFLAFFPAKMERGVDVVLKYVNFDDYVKDADLVITGEGQVDFQTASGKTPLGVAQAAQKRQVPTIILAGAVGEGIEVLYDYGIVSVHSIVDQPMTLQASMANANRLLEKSTEQIIRAYFYLWCQSLKTRKFE